MLGRIGALIVIALATGVALLSGSALLWFLIWLAGLTVGGSYMLVRHGLAGLEAGAWPDRRQASVGDGLSLTYTLRSTSRLPRPWLEVHSPSTLPVAIPGRVVALGPRTARTWAARVPLPERGQFRIEALVIRTGDPLGIFESVARVGPVADLLVYPAVEALPAWSLPSVDREGPASRTVAGLHQGAVASSVRPYTPGDGFNRIHWPSSARHGELQVKETDIEPSADVCLFLDLQAAVHVGTGPLSSLESAISVAAALSGHALTDGRGVAFEARGQQRLVLPVDRGPRQRHKLLGLLAVAQADGTTPFAEVLVEGVRRIRRGSVALLVTPSLDTAWVATLPALRRVGVTPIVCLIDPLAHTNVAADGGDDGSGIPSSARMLMPQRASELVQALVDAGARWHLVRPGEPLGAQLASARASGGSATSRVAA